QWPIRSLWLSDPSLVLCRHDLAAELAVRQRHLDRISRRDAGGAPDDRRLAAVPPDSIGAAEQGGGAERFEASGQRTEAGVGAMLRQPRRAGQPSLRHRQGPVNRWDGARHVALL